MQQKIISVIGPSGGVGKSTIAKELSIAYANAMVGGKPLSVCIVDANPSFGSMRHLFRLAPKYSLEDWLLEYHELQSHMRFSEMISYYDWEKLERYVSFSKDFGLFILPSTSRGQYIAMTASELTMIITVLKRFFDVILIDTGSNTEPVTLEAMKVSDHNLLVVTDEKRCLSSAIKLRTILREEGLPLDKFVPVLNQYHASVGQRFYTVDEISELLYMDVDHVLPYYEPVWALQNTFGSLILQKGNLKIKNELLVLAKRMVPEVDIKTFR